MTLSQIVPKVYVDWNDDGDFSDANEDVSAYILPGLSWSRGRSSITEDFAAGAATVSLRNSTGLFTPFDSSSAIYGLMVPGRLMKVEAVHQATNLFTNPSFETDINAVASATCTLAQDATEFVYGSKSLKVTYTASLAEQVSFKTPGGANQSVTPGEWYTLSLWLKSGTAAGTCHIGFRWLDSGGAPINHDWGLEFRVGSTEPNRLITLVGGDAWTRYWVSAQAPAGAVTAIVNFEESAGFGAGETLFIDGVTFANYKGNAGDIEGDLTGCSWNGTAHASTSTGPVTYPIITGRLASIEQSRDVDTPFVRLTLEEESGRMSQSHYNAAAALLNGGLVSAIIAAILTDYGVAGGDQVLDTALETLASFWNPPGGSHLDAVKSAAKQELGGYYFIRSDGKHKFGNREARGLEAIHCTWTGAYASSMSISQSDFIDQVVHKRAGLDVSGTTEAAYNDFPTGREIPPGSTDAKNTFHGDYIAAAKNVVQPVPSLDYTANTQADGLGADVTNQVSVSAFTSFGGGFEITMNNASGATAYLTLFVVRGQLVRQSDDRREISVTDASSPVRNQTLRDEFAFNDNVDGIRGYALFRLFAGSAFYPRHLQINREPLDDAEAVDLLGLELEKRVHISNTTGLWPSNIDDDYFVEAISGSFLQGGLMEVTCDLWHEISAVGNFFRISGDVGGGQDYSLIVAAGATTGDRIAF